MSKSYKFAIKVLITILIISLAAAAPEIAHTQSGPPGNKVWFLVFSDDFDRPKLDTSKWMTCYYWDATGNGCTNSGNQELEWYTDQNVSVSDGVLHLITRKERVTGSDGKQYGYTSGMVTTSNPGFENGAKFAFKYGYAEARVKMAAGKGLWPAFWLTAAAPHWPPEIDIFEAIGQYINKVVMTIHWADSSLGKNWHQARQGKFIGPDFSAGWHTFAIDWEPNYIVWYVDGVERYRHDGADDISNEPMVILLNQAIGGSMPGKYGAPDKTTSLPADYQIDYVRVWQKGG